MAKMVFLAGLRPLTLNIDYQIGMESMVQEIAPKWSSYSKEFVNVSLNFSLFISVLQSYFIGLLTQKVAVIMALFEYVC